MSFLIDLKKQIIEINNIINLINENIKKCNICNKNGYIEKQQNILNINITFKENCICSIYNNKSLEEYIKIKQNLLEKYYYLNSNIPPIYKNLKINIPDEILLFLKSFKNFLWITGNTGSGKTSLLYLLKIKLYLENNKNFNITKEYDLNLDIINVDAIDDVGLSENINRNLILCDIYYKLIDYKVENKQKLIFTSNLKLEEWLEKINNFNLYLFNRIQSRLYNNIIIYKTKDIDYRKEVKKM